MVSRLLSTFLISVLILGALSLYLAARPALAREILESGDLSTRRTTLRPVFN